MAHTEILRDISFDDIWNRLSDAEKYVCCTRGTDSGWETFIAWAPRERYIANRDSNLTDLKKFVRGEQERGRRIFGYLAYDAGYALHNITPRARNDLKLPDIIFYSYDAYVACRGDGIEIRAADSETLAAFFKSVKGILLREPAVNRPFRDRGVLNPAARKTPLRTSAGRCAGFWTPRLGDAKALLSYLARSTSPVKTSGAGTEFMPTMSPETYTHGYESVKKHIIDGDIYQMNLTHRLEGSTEKTPRELFSATWEKNHADFSAYLEADGFEILSASPERFISISANRQIDTFPIKGTRPRGINPVEDERLRKELYSSEKETAELTMITDLLRNDIGKVCEFGSVRVVSPRIVSAFASVWHAYSHISGICAKGIRSIDALISMFPGGSVTGCPKKRAMEIIDELEPTTRSVYAGSIGWIDPDDSADFNIAIRTLIKKGKHVFLQVGGGIVYDSVERDEYQETLDKAQSFLGIL